MGLGQNSAWIFDGETDAAKPKKTGLSIANNYVSVNLRTFSCYFIHIKAMLNISNLLNHIEIVFSFEQVPLLFS